MTLRWLPFFLLLFACRRTPLPPPPSEPRPDLPPLPELVLAFQGELDRESTEVSPEIDSPSLRWNLGPNQDHRYRISQTVANYSSTRDRLGTSEIRSNLRGEGNLQLLGTPSGMGKAYYKMTLRESIVNGRPSSPEELNQQPPAKIEFRLREDGEVEGSKSHAGGEAQALEFLFRLPGPTETRPHRSSGAYRQQGTLSTRRTGFARVEGRACARIETTVTLELAPVTGDDSGKGKMIGRIVGYFAIDEGRFLRVDAAFSFVYHTRQKYSKPEEGDRWNVGTTESHTLLKVRP